MVMKTNVLSNPIAVRGHNAAGLIATECFFWACWAAAWVEKVGGDRRIRDLKIRF